MAREEEVEAPTGADDFDTMAWCYDLAPVPTHPKRLAPRLRGVQGVILDLGGGTGKYTMKMTDPERHRAVIVDPSRKMLAKGRRKGRQAGFIQAMGEALPLPDKSVAAVVATEAFHHFGDTQKRIVQETVRVLRDDGMLLIEEPDPSRLFGRIMSWGERTQGMSSVFHPPARLVAMVEPYFRHVETTRTGWFTYRLEAVGPRNQRH